jgi:hypothetical protein
MSVRGPITRRLDWLPGRLAIVRLGPKAEIPAWAWTSPFASVTRTRAEVSVVTDQTAVPNHVEAARGWRALVVAGPMDLSIVGVLASITASLAEAEIPLFAISTYETDYILVGEENAARAAEALRNAGWEVGD